MDCSELVRSLVERAVLSEQAREHLRTCQYCHELVGALDSPRITDRSLSPSIHTLRESLSADLRPAKPFKPAYLAAAFIAVFLLIVGGGLIRWGAPTIAAMSLSQATWTLVTIGASMAALVGSIVAQMFPGSRFRIRPALIPITIVVMLMFVIASLFHFDHDPDFWQRGSHCLFAGLSFALIAALPFWAILRKGAILSPGLTGASAGLLAGLAGLTVLELHCSDLTAWHILTWHIGAALAAALIGLTIGVALERFHR
jgi:hypothetical protein